MSVALLIGNGDQEVKTFDARPLDASSWGTSVNSTTYARLINTAGDIPFIADVRYNIDKISDVYNSVSQPDDTYPINMRPISSTGQKLTVSVRATAYTDNDPFVLDTSINAPVEAKIILSVPNVSDFVTDNFLVELLSYAIGALVDTDGHSRMGEMLKGKIIDPAIG